VLVDQELVGASGGDELGQAVQLSSDGSIMAIGAYLADSVQGVDSGKVYVLKEVEGEWKAMGQIISFNPLAQAGWALDLSTDGTILAVGGWTGGFLWEGIVRVYKYDTEKDTWSRLGQELQGQKSAIFFGGTVSLSSDGMTLAVGADFANDGEKRLAGLVRVYRFDSVQEQWNELGPTLYGDAAEDHFGWDVDLSGNGSMLVVGATDHDSPTGVDSGHVRVFWYNNTAEVWEPMGQVLNGEAPGDSSGHAVSISHDGMTVAVGAIHHDDDENTDAGHVRVYQFSSSGTWLQMGQDLKGNAPNSKKGRSVSLSADGTMVAVGSTPENDPGTVAVYQYHEGSWYLVADFLEGGTSGTGTAISLTSTATRTRLAVGSPDYGTFLNSNRGLVQVYELKEESQ